MTPWLRAGFIAVPVLWVAAAQLGPLVALVRISLLASFPAPPGVEPGWSLAAYAAFWDGPGYRLSLLYSLALAAGTTLICLLLCYPLAYHVARRVPAQRRRRRLLLLVTPFWTSEVLRMFGVVLLLANRGALNSVLRALGITAAPLPLLYGHGAVLAGMVYTVLLTMLLPLTAALDRLPAEVLEAATDLGAGAWQRFRHVTLPLTMRGIGAGCILTFLASLGVLAAPALLGGAGTPVFSIVTTGLFGAASGRWPMGAAFGFILLLAGTAGAAILAIPSRAASEPA